MSLEILGPALNQEYYPKRYDLVMSIRARAWGFQLELLILETKECIVLDIDLGTHIWLGLFALSFFVFQLDFMLLDFL